MKNAKYLEVEAQVRYWEDATVNGVCDESGESVPFKKGNIWNPIIDLDNGVVIDWPEGISASIHFKVCDAGEYFLLNNGKEKIAKYHDYYVPDSFLCHGGNGYGDYIILDIDVDGSIANYSEPLIDDEEWISVD